MSKGQGQQYLGSIITQDNKVKAEVSSNIPNKGNYGSEKI